MRLTLEDYLFKPYYTHRWQDGVSVGIKIMPDGTSLIMSAAITKKKPTLQGGKLKRDQFSYQRSRDIIHGRIMAYMEDAPFFKKEHPFCIELPLPAGFEVTQKTLPLIMRLFRHFFKPEDQSPTLRSPITKVLERRGPEKAWELLVAQMAKAVHSATNGSGAT